MPTVKTATKKVTLDDVNNDEHDIHAEIDAFLENGTQAMAVEVKAKLQTSDVDKGNC